MNKPVVWLLGIVLMAGAAAVVYQQQHETKPIAKQDAKQHEGSSEDVVLPEGLTLAGFNKAKSIYQERFGVTPKRHEVLGVAAEIAMSEQKLETALNCYREIPPDDPNIGMKAQLEQGLILVKLDRVAEAEHALTAYIMSAREAKSVAAADVIDAFKWLCFIMSVEIRLEDRKEVLLELHRAGLADPWDSKQLFFPNLLILNSTTGRDRIQKFLAHDPENINLQVANARYMTLAGEHEAAIVKLEELMAKHPNNLSVAACLLEAWFETDDQQKMRELIAKLPSHSQTEPWLLTYMRAEAALAEKDFLSVITLCKSVLNNDPAYLPCEMALASAYAAKGETELQKAQLERVSILAKMRVNLGSVRNDAPAAAGELSEMCRELKMDAAAQYFQKYSEAMKAQQPQ